MGFFDKVKGFFNSGGAKIEITEVEDPFPYTDSCHRGWFVVNAGDREATINSYRASFYAVFEDSDGTEVEVEFDEDRSENYTDNEFPLKVAKGGQHRVSFLVSDVNIVEDLKKYNMPTASAAKAHGAKFFIKIEVDIAEAAGLFDPTAKREVQVIDKEAEA